MIIQVILMQVLPGLYFDMALAVQNIVSFM